jgi:hypothetical protein
MTQFEWIRADRKCCSCANDSYQDPSDEKRTKECFGCGIKRRLLIVFECRLWIRVREKCKRGGKGKPYSRTVCGDENKV